MTPDFRQLALACAHDAIETLWEDSREEIFLALEDEEGNRSYTPTETDLDTFREGLVEAMSLLQLHIKEES